MDRVLYYGFFILISVIHGLAYFRFIAEKPTNCPQGKQLLPSLFLGILLLLIIVYKIRTLTLSDFTVSRFQTSTNYPILCAVLCFVPGLMLFGIFRFKNFGSSLRIPNFRYLLDLNMYWFLINALAMNVYLSNMINLPVLLTLLGFVVSHLLYSLANQRNVSV